MTLHCSGVIFQFHWQCLGVVCKFHLHGWDASFTGSCPPVSNRFPHTSSKKAFFSSDLALFRSHFSISLTVFRGGLQISYSRMGRQLYREMSPRFKPFPTHINPLFPREDTNSGKINLKVNQAKTIKNRWFNFGFLDGHYDVNMSID